MSPETFPFIILLVVIILGSAFLRLAFFTVPQNKVALILRFGKYHALKFAGLNTKTPFLDTYIIITLQNISTELAFQAITADQANVSFKALVVYAAKDTSEDSIKKIAFTFNTIESFEKTLGKTIEGMIRSFIAAKNQKDILTIRSEIVEYVQTHIKANLDQWGYMLHDIQINDISFDQVIMESMAQVVASSNLKAAAENEGQALLIKKTKDAEAEGKYVTILAENEKNAEILRGQGVAGFREEIAKGLKASINQIGEGSDDAVQLITFSMWMDAFKHIAENGKGNFISFDGSPDSMEKFFQSSVITGGKDKVINKMAN